MVKQNSQYIELYFFFLEIPGNNLNLRKYIDKPFSYLPVNPMRHLMHI